MHNPHAASKVNIIRQQDPIALYTMYTVVLLILLKSEERSQSVN
jgi:hypothetical protein